MDATTRHESRSAVFYSGCQSLNRRPESTSRMERNMEKKIETKNTTVETKDTVKPGRLKIRKLPDRPLGLIQGN